MGGVIPGMLADVGASWFPDSIPAFRLHTIVTDPSLAHSGLIPIGRAWAADGRQAAKPSMHIRQRANGLLSVVTSYPGSAKMPGFAVAATKMGCCATGNSSMMAWLVANYPAPPPASQTAATLTVLKVKAFARLSKIAGISQTGQQGGERP